MKLIDKDALVAWALEELKLAEKFYKETKSDVYFGKINLLKKQLSFLDTLEVKEVDLEKEIQMFSMDLAMKENNGDWEKDIAVTAKHFFKLGIAVSNKTQKGK